MTFYAEKFVIFILVFIRMLSMFLTAPLYGNNGIPAQLKIWGAAAVAFVIYPLIAAGSPSISLDLGSLIVLALQEIVVGSVIGFSLGILFDGVTYAGEILGIAMGLSISSVIDPQNGVNVPVIGQFEYIVAVFIFLLLNGHLYLLQAVKMSYNAVPISGLKVSGSAVNLIVNMTGMVFVAAIKIGAPVIVSLFLTDVLLGIISRMVPQVNVFFVGMPLSVGIGLFMLMASLPFFVVVFEKLLNTFESEVVQLIGLM